MVIKKISALIENRKAIVVLFFAAYFFTGLAVFGDYGVSCDEYFSRERGRMSLDYIFGGDASLREYKYAYHGVALEIPLTGIERAFGLTDDTKAAYTMRRLTMFLLFFTGVIFFYLLCRRRFGSRKIALLGSLFLVLSPRIFAHSFYNPKDIPFMVFFLISMYTLMRYLDRKTLMWIVAHAAVTAVLFNVRIAGIIVPLLSIIFITAEFLRKAPRRMSAALRDILIYLVLFVSLSVALWPFLWGDPAGNLIKAIDLAKLNNWSGQVLYLGRYMHSTEIPWHYIPVWIAVSTPLVYLVLFITGSCLAVSSFFKNDMRSYPERRDGHIVMAWLFIPVLWVIGFKVPVYDGWRHLFFIYPAFLIFSLSGLSGLVDLIMRRFTSRLRTALIALLSFVITVSLLNIAVFMIRCHPHQNLFFNRLAGGDMSAAKKRFGLDYWGMSYRNGLEYILRNDPSEKIRVFPDNILVEAGALMLPTGERKRLVFTENPRDAKYLITNYRWHDEEYLPGDPFYTITIDRAKIVAVYKLGL